VILYRSGALECLAPVEADTAGRKSACLCIATKTASDTDVPDIRWHGGRDAIHEILKIDPGAKVIISSGNPIDSVMTNFHEHGFRAAIGKPIALAELNATINFVLDVDTG